MKFYLGIVDEYKTDGTITFDIEGLDKFTKKPTARSSVDLPKKPKKGDQVLIFDLYENTSSFLYQPLSTGFVGIENEDFKIDLTEKDSAKINFGSYDLQCTKTNVTINLGSVKLEADSSGVTLSGSGFLKVNGLYPVGGPFLIPGAITPAPGNPLAPVTTNAIPLSP